MEIVRRIKGLSWLWEKKWRRIIVHVDMDAFFASVEQRDFPHLQNKPICVTNGKVGSCVITRSYEARAYGVKTGMRLKEARLLCPQLIQCSSRPEAYAAASKEIMRVLQTISPDIEIFSVDEAFLDLTRCRMLYRSANQVARLIQHRVYQAVGLNCSVGISGDKTTAKYSSKKNKPNGFHIIPPWEAQQALADLPVTELCGIGTGVARFLAQYGAYYCGDVAKLPISLIAKRFGNLGRRIWFMCNGEDLEPMHLDVAPPKSLGHGKVMPPNTKDKKVILGFFAHMSQKLGRRMRANQLVAQRYWVALKTESGWLSTKTKTVVPTNDDIHIYNLARQLVEHQWGGDGTFQCQITALDPQQGLIQGDLFVDNDQFNRGSLNNTVDNINSKYGKCCLVRAANVNKLETPDVIAPAWRPDGVRSSI